MKPEKLSIDRLKVMRWLILLKLRLKRKLLRMKQGLVKA